MIKSDVLGESKDDLCKKKRIDDAFHNFIDGVIITATFVVSIPLGIATSLAVISHEIPQEVGDFAILLESGYQKGRAFILNTISGLSTLFGAIVAYLFLSEMMIMTPYIVVLSAASFIYIAIADLIPSLHQYPNVKNSIIQLALIVGGIGTIALIHIRH